MAKVIAIASQKGGIGKTTTAVSLATGLATKGFKTLLIDNEPQRSATRTYRAQVENTATLYDLLFGNEKAVDCIQHTPVGDIIAGDPLLNGADQKFPTDGNRNFLLKKKCAELNDLYDFIIIDTPPGLGVILTNALTFADELIIPTSFDDYAIGGIADISQTCESVKKHTNPNLKVRGIIVTRYEGLNLDKSTEEIMPTVTETLNTELLKPYIRKCVLVRESQTARQSIFTYAPKCTSALDYMEICDILAKEVNK